MKDERHTSENYCSDWSDDTSSDLKTVQFSVSVPKKMQLRSDIESVLDNKSKL